MNLTHVSHQRHWICQTRRNVLLLTIAVLVVLLSTSARAIDQAMPTQTPAAHGQSAAPSAPGAQEAIIAAQDRSAFRKAIRLDEIRTLGIQHNEQVKILDSWARQSLTAIRNLQKIDGEDPLYSALDMAFRPEAWLDKNIIYIQAIPIRQQLAQLVTDKEEQNRIVTRATVSPRFISRDDVQALLHNIASNVPLSQAVNKVLISQNTFFGLSESLLLIAPAESSRPWIHPMILAGNVPDYAAQLNDRGMQIDPDPEFTPEASRKLVDPFVDLGNAWRANAPALANGAMATMATLYPQTNSSHYPTPFARNLEMIYVYSFNGTIVAYIYFLAFVLFTIGAMANQPRTRFIGLIVFATAVFCHLLAMSIRYYLAGRIPIQNQFESVLGAALIGCIVGLVAESIKRNGLFGMAFSFVGFLAMTCCFVVPFVIGKSIGESIGKVAGILNNTSWLYIHVNTVIASYALIAAAAVLGGVYLIAKTWHWINPIDDAAGLPSPGGAGMVAATGLIDSMKFHGAQQAVALARRTSLEKIDAATVILLQMSFWVLGTGIVFGAIWADVSWGRPWGWDPKETFALVTWIVYLVIIHVRFITPKHRATVTAVLAVVGLAIMLFNWIGVNFYLAGLHSYA